jgi:hypothetical protein
MIVAHIPPFSNIPIDVEQVHEFILIFLSLDHNLLMLVGPSLGPFLGVCFPDLQDIAILMSCLSSFVTMEHVHHLKLVPLIYNKSHSHSFVGYIRIFHGQIRVIETSLPLSAA